MAQVIIKIGENEPATYARFDQLYHHMDIVEILEDSVDPGEKTKRHFLIINVDTLGMPSELYKEWRGSLMDGVVIENAIHRRRYQFDCTLAKFISSETRGKIEAQAAIKSAIKPQVYQYIENYKLTENRDPPDELVAAYKDELESGFSMESINKPAVETKADFDAAVFNKITTEIFSMG